LSTWPVEDKMDRQHHLDWISAGTVLGIKQIKASGCNATICGLEKN